METSVTNKFSFRRTFELMQKIIIEQPRANLMKLLLLFGSFIFFSIFIGYIEPYNNPFYHPANDHDPAIKPEFIYYVFMMYVFGTIYASTAFSKLGTRSGSISLLTVPANSSEKFLANWAVHVVGFFVLFVIAAWFSDVCRVIVMKISYPDCNYIHTMSWSDLKNRDLPVIVTTFLMFQSFFLLGSIVWPRYSFIKTFAALTIIGTIYAITASICLILTFKHNQSLVYFDNFDPTNIVITIVIIVSLINYGLTYLRLRETEVINRA